MDLNTYLQFGLALVFVLALIAVLAALLRRSGLGGPTRKRGKQRRLGVVDVLALDNRRRLVLIHRDGVEHLILLGQNEDVVVETGIRAQASEFDTAVATAGSSERPAGLRMAPRPDVKPEGSRE